MTTRPFTLKLLLLVGLLFGVGLGACRDGGLLEPPVTGGDTCCAKLVVSATISRTTAPLAGVQVALRTGTTVVKSGVTNADGIVVFSNVCNGTYNLRLSREGYQVAERGEVTVHGCDTTKVGFAMMASGGQDSCCHGMIAVMPLDSMTGTRIDGAVVKLWKGGQLLRTATVNGHAVVFDGLCPGTYGVSVNREGYGGVEFQFTSECTSQIERVVGMRRINPPPPPDTCCNNVVEITVFNGRTQAPVAGAVVVLKGPNGAEVRRATTGDYGSVRFGELCHGAYVVVIERAGFQRLEQRFEVTCGSVRDLHYVLNPSTTDCCNNSAVIHLVDGNRMPIAGATLTLATSAGQVPRTATSDASGNFTLRELCAGEYAARIAKEGYQVIEFKLTIVCGVPYEATKVMERNANDSCRQAGLKFRTVGPDGGWIAGVNVTIAANGAIVAQGTTDVEGWYTKTGLLAPMVYTVTFYKQGFQRQTITFRVGECKLYQETIHMTR